MHREIAYLVECHFVNQKVNHGRNILTVRMPTFYNKENICNEPGSEPKVNHNRTIKEEGKEREEEILYLDNLNTKKNNKKKDDKDDADKLLDFNKDHSEPTFKQKL